MKPIARKDELVIQEMGGEILVYDLRTDKAICLNQTSALVWQNCDGKKDALGIAKNIEKELGSKVTEDFVWFAISQLKKESLLENKTLVNKFEGMSRREVIKKVGLGTMVALPIVSGLIAPTAAMAQSAVMCSCPNGQAPNATSCTNSTQCMAGQTCSGVTCNGGGNSCGTLNGTCM